MLTNIDIRNRSVYSNKFHFEDTVEMNNNQLLVYMLHLSIRPNRNIDTNRFHSHIGHHFDKSMEKLDIHQYHLHIDDLYTSVDTYNDIVHR